MTHEPTRPGGKILLVRLSSLGDILHAIPAQQALFREGGAEIHWLAESAFAPLLERVPGIFKIWPVDLRNGSRSSPGAFLRTLRSLRKERFDVAIDFQALLKSALLARLSGARRVIGFDAAFCREKSAAWFYSERVRPAGERLHAIELGVTLLGPLGHSGDPNPAIPLDIPKEAEDRVDWQLRDRGLRDFVVLNLGGGWSTKLWPPHEFAQLADMIHDQLGIPSLLTFGPGEEALVETTQSLAKTRPSAFATSLFELAALCRRARVVVAGDTGPLHLAVALGTPTVAILGPTSAWRNGPFNPEDLTVKRDLPCSDCYRRSCERFICMQISSREVFEAVRRRIGK